MGTVNPATGNVRKRIGRVPLLILGIAALATGVWGGLIRLSLNLPLAQHSANWITFHGPLMVCGFLGTVIGLERAVGLQRGWTYLAPILSGAGALILLASGPTAAGQWLTLAGSAVFVGVMTRVFFIHKVLFTGVMMLAAVCWFCGNLLWLRGWEIPRVAPWWIAFLGLTIFGERLDLSRFHRMPSWAPRLFVACLSLFMAGVVLSAFQQGLGERLTGVGMIALAIWLGCFDIARRTVNQPGLPRFMAVCLLSGYVWLAMSGAMLAGMNPLVSGSSYDAALHAFFLGFVFSMIFGHAPVIFPSVLHLPLAFHGRFYTHVILLHLSLLLRIAADHSGWVAGRQWGSILNGIAILLFLLNTITAMLLAPKPVTRMSKARPGREQPATG